MWFPRTGKQRLVSIHDVCDTSLFRRRFVLHAPMRRGIQRTSLREGRLSRRQPMQ